jgi:ribosome-binding protein aMBF1 (putative translation factor)
MGVLDGREVVRCDDCTLMQFVTRSGRCRKCQLPYEVAPAPLAIAAVDPEQTTAPWDINSAFARLFKLVRQAKGLSQRQWASLLGMSKSYISKIENECAVPRSRTIVDICERLGIDPACFAEALEIAARGSNQ